MTTRSILGWFSAVALGLAHGAAAALAQSDGRMPAMLPTLPASPIAAPTMGLTVPGSPPIPPPPPPAPSLHTTNFIARPADATPGENPTRQEPAVRLEWLGPPNARVGQASDYAVVVRNIRELAVQQVAVRVRLPAGMTAAETDPPATAADKEVLLWELGMLSPGQERTLQLRLIPGKSGDVAPQAWVTFTGSSILRVRVREPRLALVVNSPKRVAVGDTAPFVVTVSNPGDGAAEQVRVAVHLTEGLEHTRGSKVQFDVGTLAPGESRNLQVICTARAAGEQRCTCHANADGGLLVQEQGATSVIVPRLNLAVTGPGLRYLERRAVYSLKVTNPGDGPAGSVSVSNIIPVGFKFIAASDGGRHDFATRCVTWAVGDLAPGETRELKLEVVAASLGEQKHRAVAVGARGLRAEAEAATRIEGLSALLVEVVDTDDPLEVGAETVYEVRVTNTGSKADGEVKLTAQVPEQMELRGVQAAVRYKVEGSQIVFEPLTALAARTDAVFRIQVKALKPGDVRFKVQATSANVTEPVVGVEATRIYADR